MRIRDIFQGGAEMLEAAAHRMRTFAAKNGPQEPGEMPRVVRGQLDALGREVPDPTPMSVPINRRRGADVDAMRNHLQAISQLAASEGFETFEESEQFDYGDNRDLPSPYYHASDEEIWAFGKQILGAGYELNAEGDQFIKTVPAAAPPPQTPAGKDPAGVPATVPVTSGGPLPPGPASA